jgi:hypothetical protein
MNRKEASPDAQAHHFVGLGPPRFSEYGVIVTWPKDRCVKAELALYLSPRRDPLESQGGGLNR